MRWRSESFGRNWQFGEFGEDSGGGCHEVATVKDMGWKGIQSGALLALAQQSGFEVPITGDNKLRHQQNPAGRMIAWLSCLKPSGRS